MATARDTVTTAFRELSIAPLVGSLPGELATLGLDVVNRILDDWNAERGAIYADVHSSLYTITANLNPHTIGLTANAPTWSVTTNRPVSVEGIRLTTDDGETYFAPMNKRDAEWWHHRASPGTTSAYPTDFYYDPTWPNGSMYFYPEPSTAHKVQLWMRTVLAQLTLNSDVTYPPGYLSALTETLKERLVQMPMFKSAGTADIPLAAARARATAFANNTTPPYLCTADAGLPGSGGWAYDYRTGPYR